MPREQDDWKNLHLWQIQPVRDGLVFAGVFGIVYLGYVLRVVTVPILLALALAYLFEPLVGWLARRGSVRRPVSAAAIIVLAAVVIVVPAVAGLVAGGVQASQAARSIAGKVDLVYRSTQHPEDTALLTALYAPAERAKPSGERVSNAWVDLRNWLVEQERRAGLERQISGSNSTADPEQRKTPDGEGTPGDKQPDDKPPGDAPGGTRPDGTRAEPADGASGDAERRREPVVEGGAPGEPAADAPPGDAGEPPEKPKPELTNPGAPATGGSIVESAVAELLPPEAAYAAAQWLIRWMKANVEAIGQHALEAGGGAVGAVGGAVGWLGRVAFGGFLTAFFFYFFVVGYDHVLRFGRELVPKTNRGRVLDLVHQMDRVIAGFIRGRLTIATILTLYYIIGYWIIGVPAFLILGIVVGVLTLVPYAAGIGIPAAILLLWLSAQDGVQGTWWWILGAPMVVHSLQQLLDDYFLTPRIQGKSTNMDTPTILFASIAGGVLAGFYGLLLAIPVAACIKILLKEVFWPRFKAWSEGRASDFLPIGKE
ncbi:MAG: AI-2E family transporter [Planctomycetota bacterium]|nr:AI-2E family transporter [Planctomycetota bacterium]